MDIKKVHGSVLVVSTEDNAEDVSVRLNKLVQETGFIRKNLRFIFNSNNVIPIINQELKRQPADIVLIDTFGDLFRGHLNDSISVRQFIKPFKEIANTHKCLVFFNHHIGKGKENNSSPNKTDMLGSQAIESACRTVIMLRKNSDATRVLTVVKGNHIPDNLKNKGIVMEFDPMNGLVTTGNSIDYSAEKGSVDDPALITKVLSLYPQHKSYQKVAEELRKEGIKIDKNRVMKIWNANKDTENPEDNKEGRQEAQAA